MAQDLLESIFSAYYSEGKEKQSHVQLELQFLLPTLNDEHYWSRTAGTKYVMN